MDTGEVSAQASAKNTRSFCSRRAQAAGEQLFGTATRRITTWLLLEVPRPWGADALADSDLPPVVKQQGFDWLDALPQARFQFIRREVGVWDASGRIRFYVARLDASPPRLERYSIRNYEDLLDLNVETSQNEGAAVDDDLLVLTCVNGNRDACCAKWGRPVFQALSNAAGTSAWQTTHLGGHRFAATAVVLPHGMHYGWLEPEDAEPLMDAHRSGQIYRLDRLRGRMCWDRPVQAAEYYLRRTTGQLGISAFRFEGAEQTGDEWTVRFAAFNSDAVYQVELAEELSAFAHPLSCGDDQAKRVPQYRLRAVERK